jgi:hypothetical protein
MGGKISIHFLENFPENIFRKFSTILWKILWKMLYSFPGKFSIILWKVSRKCSKIFNNLCFLLFPEELEIWVTKEKTKYGHNFHFVQFITNRSKITLRTKSIFSYFAMTLTFNTWLVNTAIQPIV